MTAATFRNYSGTAAELYESFFVPSIATPVSGELLRAAGLQRGERVLDVGCGTGTISRAAAEQVGTTGSVTAVDLAADMLDVARSIPAVGAPIGWYEADAASLPLSDASYDVALSQLSLQFVEDRAGALAEIHRVLAPGGRIVISTPGRIQPQFEAMEHAIVDNLGADLGAFVTAVFSMPDPAALGELVAEAGFDDVSSVEYSATLDLPGPAEFLWKYVNLTPMGGLVANAPEEAKDATERQFVHACASSLVAGRLRIDQPMALAWAVRA